MVFFLFLVLPWLTLGCGKGKEPAAHKGNEPATTPAPSTADESDIRELTMESIEKEGKMQEVATGTVQITPEQQQLIGVKIGSVDVRPLEKVIRTVGRIDYDEKRLATVSLKVGGWVEDLSVDFTGKYVTKGEPLLAIYSPELVSTQEEYLAAREAKKSMAQSSFPEVVASGDSLVEAAKRRLQLWDVPDEEIRKLEERGHASRTITFYAPLSGFVIEKSAYKGMSVTPGMVLYRLADLTVVWLYADIYEYEIPYVRLGQRAAVQLTALPGETFTGKVVYISPLLDPNTRTAKVRFSFPNPHGKLKPEMFATVEIKVPLGKKLAVPEAGVIDTGIRRVAIVDKGEGYFEPREIKVGVKAENYYEVLSGLKAGERVVTSANFLIDSESKLKEALGNMAGMPGMEHGGKGK
jgi:Cu(I)/Ag(I) efflux system membrane fusion protein